MGADATITLEAKFVSDLQRTISNLKKQVDDLGETSKKSFDKANKSASVFLDTMKGFLAATGVIAVIKGIGEAATGMASGFIKANAAYETSITAFRTLLKDGNKAKALMEDLTKFSIETPFESEPINQAAKSLLAFGSSSTNVVNELRMLGDIASGVKAPLGEIAEIYGKNRVQGRLFMQDINQLTGRGIPIITELAKQFKVSESAIRDMVEKGKIGFPELEKAFQSLTTNGGRFEGQMKQQSMTFTGLMSTLKESVTQFFVTLGQSGVWAEFVKYLQQAATWTEKNQQKIQEFAKSLGQNLISALRLTVDHFKELIGIGSTFLAVFAYSKLIPLSLAFTKAGGAVGVFSRALSLLTAHPALLAITALSTGVYALTAAMEENAKKAEAGGFRGSIEQLEKLKSIAGQYQFISEKLKGTTNLYDAQGLSRQLNTLGVQFKEITGFTFDSAQGQALLNSKTKDGITVIDLHIKKLMAQKAALADANKPVEEVAKKKAKELTPEEIEAAKKRKEQTLKMQQELEDARLLQIEDAREREYKANDLKYERDLEHLKGNEEARKALKERYAIQEVEIKDKYDKIAQEKRIEAMKKRLAKEREENEASIEMKRKKMEVEERLADQSIALANQLMQLGEAMVGKNKALFYMTKAIAFAEALINTALGVTKALASYDFIGAALIGVTGGAKAATIAATTISPKGYLTGGMIHGKNQLIMTNEDGRSEAVLNHRAVKSIGSEGVNALNSGRGISPNVSFGPTIINISGNADRMTVTQIDSAVRQSRDQQMRAFKQMDRETRDVKVRG